MIMILEFQERVCGVGSKYTTARREEDRHQRVKEGADDDCNGVMIAIECLVCVWRMQELEQKGAETEEAKACIVQ